MDLWSMFYRGKHIIYGRFMFICFLKSNNTDIQGLLFSIRCLFGNESQLRILAEQWHSLCKCPLGKNQSVLCCRNAKIGNINHFFEV